MEINLDLILSICFAIAFVLTILWGQTREVPEEGYPEDEIIDM